MFGFLINMIDVLSFLNVFDKEDKKVTLDEIANLMSEHTDRIIIDLIRKESLNFGGGVFEVSYDNKQQKNFYVNLKLYFLDKKEEFLLKETSKIFKISNLADEDVVELKKLKKISYSVHKPVI